MSISDSSSPPFYIDENNRLVMTKQEALSDRNKEEQRVFATSSNGEVSAYQPMGIGTSVGENYGMQFGTSYSSHPSDNPDPWSPDTPFYRREYKGEDDPDKYVNGKEIIRIYPARDHQVKKGLEEVVLKQTSDNQYYIFYKDKLLNQPYLTLETDLAEIYDQWSLTHEFSGDEDNLVKLFLTNNIYLNKVELPSGKAGYWADLSFDNDGNFVYQEKTYDRDTQKRIYKPEDFADDKQVKDFVDEYKLVKRGRSSWYDDTGDTYYIYVDNKREKWYFRITYRNIYEHEEVVFERSFKREELVIKKQSEVMSKKDKTQDEIRRLYDKAYYPSDFASGKIDGIRVYYGYMNDEEYPRYRIIHYNEYSNKYKILYEGFLGMRTSAQDHYKQLNIYYNHINEKILVDKHAGKTINIDRGGIEMDYDDTKELIKESLEPLEGRISNIIKQINMPLSERIKRKYEMIKSKCKQIKEFLVTHKRRAIIVALSICLVASIALVYKYRNKIKKKLVKAA